MSNVPYIFMMKIEDGTPVEIAAIKSTTIVNMVELGCAIIRVPNPKIMRRFPEKYRVDNMEPLEDHGRPENHESVRANPGDEHMEDEEEELFDPGEELTEEEEAQRDDTVFPRSTQKR